MEDIIKQIVQIDSVALNTQKANQEALKQKKEHYEKQITTYREETIEKAQKTADELYNQIVASGMSEHNLEEEKCKKVSLYLENHYLQIEEALLNKVFNELFEVEG